MGSSVAAMAVYGFFNFRLREDIFLGISVMRLFCGEALHPVFVSKNRCINVPLVSEEDKSI